VTCIESLPTDVRPYARWASITPSDSTVLSPAPDALLLRSGVGNVRIAGSDDVEITVNTTVDYSIVPVSPKKIMATGTTPGSVIALYR
jgi:hypothetical protein